MTIIQCYPELSRIAVGILVIAPENASCERAFSIMKFIKNNQRSCLSQLHLDNALRIGLETREPSDFPFEQLFQHQVLVIAFCANNIVAV